MPNQFEAEKNISSGLSHFSPAGKMQGFLISENKSSTPLVINGHKFIDNEGLEYLFTKDSSLINEYIKTRQWVYANELGLDGLLGQKDEYDDIDRTHSLVLLKNGKCIGGGRITMCYDHEKQLLPMENEEFSLKAKLPEMELSKSIYSEVTRLFVVEGERSAKIAGNLYILLNAKAAECGAKHIFIQAPRMQARSYKIICNRLGIKTAIMADLEVPRQDYHGNLDKIQVAVFTVNPNVNEIVK